MLELLVTLIALIPLFLALALLAKYRDLEQATVSASRLLAFECTLNPEACANGALDPVLAEAVITRSFGPTDAPIRSLYLTDPEADAGLGIAFWTDRAGRPLLKDRQAVSVSTRRQHFNSPLALAGSVSDRSFPGAVETLSNVAGPGRFGLDISGGLVDARVSTRVAGDGSRADWVDRLLPIPVQMQARTAVLGDSWAASGPDNGQPDSVHARVDAGAHPAPIRWAAHVAYAPVRALLALAGWGGLEPQAAQFRYQWVDPDRIPRDRIGPAPP